MLPGSTKGGGMAQGTPDVCKTPAPPSPSPVPVPYPNLGQLPSAQQTSTKVKFFGAEAVTLKSEIPMSQGDEAGVAGGVVSGGNMQKVTVKKGSSKVKAEGQPVAQLTSITGHNGSNANMPAGAQIVPSQTKVLVAP